LGKTLGHGMGSVSNWLAASMVFWVPCLFFTTYVGLYEGFSTAKASGFLGINYPDEYFISLIIPAMIPTIFTSYSVLNRKSMINDLVKRAGDFHQSAINQEGSVTEVGLFNTSEFNVLTLESKIQYCRDLRLIGNYEEANQYLDIIFKRYHNAKNLREKAAAHYSKSLTRENLNPTEEHNFSKEAYRLIENEPKDWLFFRIAHAFVTDDNRINGINSALGVIDDIERHIADKTSFWGIQMILLKTRYLYRSKQIQEIDFNHIERVIDASVMTKDEYGEIENKYYAIKRMYLFDRNEDDELHLLIQNKIYHHKWMGQKNISSMKNDLGRLMRKIGRYEESLKLFQENLTYHLTEQGGENIPHCYNNLGKTYWLMEDFEKAYNHAKKAYEQAQHRNFIRGKIEALTLIIKCIERRGEDSSPERVELEQLQKSHGIEAQVH
jgi:tetratricopeptide (TPR) repeat protein